MKIATDKQRAFIIRLRDERQLHPDVIEKVNIRLADPLLDAPTASVMIDYMLQHPEKDGVAPTGSGLDLTGLAAGHYAVGDVLIRIDAPEAGRWGGWVFVKNGSEYADEKFGSQRPGGTYFGSHADLLASVLDDPMAAAQHYGQITGHCAVCNRPLEDEVSVARGIGPTCWTRVKAS